LVDLWSARSAPPATLDFRIAAEIGKDDKPVDNLIPRKLAEELIRQLRDKGPQGKYDRPGGFDWFEATVSDADQFVSGVYENRHYVLLTTSEPFTMLAEQNGRRTWGLENAYLDTAWAGTTAVGIEFDANGFQQLGHLTAANIHRSLAILIDGKVVGIPKINSEIGCRAIIEGGPKGFDPATAKRIAASLRKGMPPVKSEPGAIKSTVYSPG
jgi:hypothetical protein